jgi:glycogen debranching enzyme
VTPGLQFIKGVWQCCVYSKHATAIWFCLFEGNRETQKIPLVKSGDYFCGTIAGLKLGDIYGLRADGPWQPELGHLFDASKLLVDPLARLLNHPFAYHPELGQRGVDTAQFVPKAVVSDELPDLPLRKTTTPHNIYEVGVKSFSQLNPKISLKNRGALAALAEPEAISHLKTLGIDTVELMPLHAWIDERHLHVLGLSNAWGYNAVQFMALDPRLCPHGWADLKHVVNVLHQNNIQVVLDVVFNHTGESDVFGPTLSFRGLDNLSYYAQSNGQLHNDAGCGNSLSLNASAVADMVLHSMRQLVLKTGLDGYRFDLATALGRLPTGFAPHAPLLQAISNDPILSTRILIAEPWDVGPGGYQLGQFPKQWLEWSDKYRDDVRRFWRGDDWSANSLATRICGSADVFGGRAPSASVNFIAAHDGFTLRDLTLFSSKQNYANGEDNRDGNSSEITWLGGNTRALLATLFLSRGTPMITAGDEFGRSQNGNNNAYAQDNSISWLNWEKCDLELLQFVKTLIALRKNLSEWFADEFVSGDASSWFGLNGEALNWHQPHTKFVVFVQTNVKAQLAIAFNNQATECALGLAGKWKRLFTSGNGENCPQYSVSVFLET